MKITIPISVGELLDKITILQIKSKHTDDEYVHKELEDLTKIAPKILNLNAEIYTTSIHSSQESKSANELSKTFSEFGIKVVGSSENFYEILQEIANANLQEMAGETLQEIAVEKIRVVIFGSLYLAGEVLEWCEKQ